MGEGSLLHRILYKKIYSGEIEREGKIYKKYIKKRRIHFPRDNTLIVLAIMIIVGALYFLISGLISK